MNTLLLRLVGPQQSWGLDSRFSVRDSAREPTKSGVIGLLCAALGRPRQAPLEDLASLKMGVRVDREGVLSSDYQIAQDVLTSSGKGTKSSITSHRYYLAGAAFLVGLAGENLALLQSLHAALQHPVWTLYLGRKAFIPSAPVWLMDGVRPAEDLETALRNYGWICPPPEPPPADVRVVLEATEGEQIRADVPLSFAARTFSTRRITILLQPSPATVCQEVQHVSL